MAFHLRIVAEAKTYISEICRILSFVLCWDPSIVPRDWLSVFCGEVNSRTFFLEYRRGRVVAYYGGLKRYMAKLKQNEKKRSMSGDD